MDSWDFKAFGEINWRYLFRFNGSIVSETVQMKQLKVWKFVINQLLSLFFPHRSRWKASPWANSCRTRTMAARTGTCRWRKRPAPRSVVCGAAPRGDRPSSTARPGHSSWRSNCSSKSNKFTVRLAKGASYHASPSGMDTHDQWLWSIWIAKYFWTSEKLHYCSLNEPFCRR